MRDTFDLSAFDPHPAFRLRRRFRKRAEGVPPFRVFAHNEKLPTDVIPVRTLPDAREFPW